jgi:hypothetical protein
MTTKPDYVLSAIAKKCNGIWETSKVGKLLKVTTLGPNSEIIKALIASKGESIVDLSKSTGNAETCLNHIHSQVSGRIRSIKDSLHIGTTTHRDSSDFGKTEIRDGGRAGNKLIPVHSKLIVRCAHAQTNGNVVDCALQDHLEKLPLWYVVEAKLIAGLQQSTMALVGQVETYKRARVEVGEYSFEGSLGMFLMQHTDKRWATLSELVNAFYAAEPTPTVDCLALGTLIAMTIRTGILIHVGNTDGGDRFKDRRGVQNLVEEYASGINLILNA